MASSPLSEQSQASDEPYEGADSRQSDHRCLYEVAPSFLFVLAARADGRAFQFLIQFDTCNSGFFV